MNYGLWLSAAGMQVNEYRQALVANNLANINTVGFKHDLAVIHERRVESQSNPDAFRYADPFYDRLTGGVWVRPTYHSFEQGPLTHTGRPLDVAIQGDGFFVVREGNEIRYTRDGRVVINDEGALVSAAGEGRIKFLDDGGNPVVVDRNRQVTISPDGTVEQDGTRVAKLNVVDVDAPQELRKVGKNLFMATDPTTRPSGSSLRAGFIEGSTVNPVQGLANMIEVTRTYEMNARMITLQDGINGLAVNRVGRIG